MYQVIFSKQAAKSLKKIPIDYQSLIKKKSEQLSQDPHKLDLKKLSGEYQGSYRFRVGDYRLFLKIDNIKKIIEIGEIERRTSQTYHLDLKESE